MSHSVSKILLIEDNPGDALLIEEMLGEINGYALTIADLLAAGLRLLRTEPFQLVLLDLGLPDSSGLETLRLVMAEKPEVPIIILTGLADEKLAIQAISQGAQDYLVKGRIDADLLARAIRYAVERQKAREKNEFQLAQINAIINQMTEGLVIFDREGNLLDMNPAALEIHGFKDFAAVRRHLHELPDIFEVFDLQGHFLPMEQWPIGRVLRGETIRAYEVRYRRRDTGKTWIGSYGGAPVRDRQGRLLLNIVTVRDITDLKRSEDELRKSQRLESISLLAGGIAHDFNNILTAIMGNITLARMVLPPGQKSAERLAVAEQAALRAKGLARQLLTFATGGAPIKKTISVPQLVQEAVELALRGAMVKCKPFFPADLWPVDADENQLHQALNNLIINAVQAMLEGGFLAISATNVCLDSPNTLGLPEGKFVRIEIQDQGIGIPKDEQKKIFDPYYTTKESGSGLGLSISFSIVKRHGGTITVDSTPGAGSTFTIYLPAAERMEEIPEKVAGKAIATGTGRILVMDDDETVNEITAEMLQHLGYRAETVTDGAEAVTAYQQALATGDPFAAVITDLTVPAGMGGKETVRRLLRLDPRAKVIVSSGYANDPIMSNHLEYGFKGILPKPYKLDELGRTIQEVISKEK